MAKLFKNHTAFGRPGIEPRWTHGDKDGVGTAYSSDSRIWFTIWNGILTELYYPTIDRPQTRDLQFLITDGETFFHEERRHLVAHTEKLADYVLGYRITNSDPGGRYSIHKEIIVAPHLSCVLQQTWLEGDDKFLSRLKMYVLCAPHMEVGGAHNNGRIVEANGRQILAAEKHGTWLAIAATVPFTRLSCGYVGNSDGWTDISNNFQMDWQFDHAPDGNIALTGELDLSLKRRFTLCAAFGNGLHNAITTLFQGLGLPFEAHCDRFIDQWQRPAKKLLQLAHSSLDNGRLYHSSYNLLLAHEDKTFPGAMIASLSIPWGEAKGDEDRGGYHLVWTRDMVKSATALLAAGNDETPFRALIYLAMSQHEDGGFSQNFWIDGRPYWRGVQLDEVAFPILLAWRLHNEHALADFDPYTMVLRAASYLIRHGPATEQDRWEEAGGYSPSTIAANIAALICAANFARERSDKAIAEFLEDYADFLECHVEEWTVTTEGSLLPDVKRHFIRILPLDIQHPTPDGNPDDAVLSITNRPPGAQWQFPAKEIVDAGFLELVRFGIRKPDDPIILDSLKVVDAILKVETPFGPCWRRYNHDGYGQRDDGSAFQGWGTGRAWPLLTAERAIYELAAGHDVTPFIRAMEGFAGPTGLLPEQIWDEPDLPQAFMRLGGPTGSARPLMWAHAEYIKLLRSASDKKVFDYIPEVSERYENHRSHRPFEIWKFNRKVTSVKPGRTLRILVADPFVLHWSMDNWQTVHDTHSTHAIGMNFVDLTIPDEQQMPIRFTFYWQKTSRWEGQDFEVVIQPRTNTDSHG